MGKKNKSGQADTQTASKRTASTLAAQIAKLGELIGPEGIKTAEQWVAKAEMHDVIRYAFKQLSNVSSRNELTKRERDTFASIVTSLGAEAAEKWRTDLLKDRNGR